MSYQCRRSDSIFRLPLFFCDNCSCHTMTETNFFMNKELMSSLFAFFLEKNKWQPDALLPIASAGLPNPAEWPERPPECENFIFANAKNRFAQFLHSCQSLLPDCQIRQNGQEDLRSAKILFSQMQKTASLNF